MSAPACSSHFPTSLRMKPTARLAELDPPWHWWDTESTSSESPISMFPDTWEDKIIFKALLPTFPGYSHLPVGHLGWWDLACDTQNSCLIITRLQLHFPIFNHFPSVISLVCMCLSTSLLMRWKPWTLTRREHKCFECANITAGETAQGTEVYLEKWPDKMVVFLIIPPLEQTPRLGGGLAEGTPS